jgi:hypothetical protein
MLARFSFDVQWLTDTLREVIQSRMKWCRMLMCFERVWKPEFIAYLIVPQLLTNIGVGDFAACPSSANNDQIHLFSWVALARAIYSTSMLERATVGCFFELQVMAPPESVEMYSEIDFWLFILLPQSASK